jgi:hypothetical protein
MTESHTLQSIRLALSNDDVRLFRNNCGVLRNEYGNFVTYGLCPGSSDLIGWKSLIIQPDMVGKRIAQFVAVEVKSNTGRPTNEQRAFILAVRQYGGRAGFARSVPEAREILDVQE